MNEIFKIPAILQKYQSMSHRSMRIIFDSQENLSDESIARISKWHEKNGWLLFLPEKVKKDEILEIVKNLPQLTFEKDEKSPGTILRAVLYRLWEQQGKQGSSELFYRQIMEKIINSFKDKLN